MTNRKHALTAIAAAALLAACGGGGDNAQDNRGNLMEAPQSVTTVATAQMDAGTAASGLQALTGKAKCDVKIVAINYATVGVNVRGSGCSGGAFEMLGDERPHRGDVLLGKPVRAPSRTYDRYGPLT